MTFKKSAEETTVVVGLSGGVDSSVTALLLKEQGYNVIAVFMRNWSDSSVLINEECPWIEDSNDAMLVAEKLNIPFQVLDLSKDYKKRIVDYMFSEYKAGRTPNPDVLCNREIKFDVFLKAAESLGADFVATGHYCQKDEIDVNGKTTYRLLAGADLNKDQSYFLCQISQEQLAKALFPIGHLQKAEVRDLAKKADLITAEKKDSQGLCFIGKVRLPDFLQQQLAPKKGRIVEIAADSPLFDEYLQSKPDVNDSAYPIWASKRWKFRAEDGKVIGEHNGAHFYTIGQRKGLHIGGKPYPSFVISTDVQENIVYVGQSEEHPGLLGFGLFSSIKESAFIREDLRPEKDKSIRVQAKIRYRQPVFDATLLADEKGYFLLFDEAHKAVAPGQFAAWYLNNELIGSGVIAEHSPFEEQMEA